MNNGGTAALLILLIGAGAGGYYLWWLKHNETEPSPPPVDNSVDVRVYVSEGVPVEGAAVTLYVNGVIQQFLYTGSDGYVVFVDQVEVGDNIMITTSKVGYYTYQSATVTAPDIEVFDMQADMVLADLTGDVDVSVRILQAGTSLELSGVEVTITINGALADPMITGSDGMARWFSITNVGDQMHVEASKSGYSSATGDYTIISSSVYAITYLLSPIS